MKKKGSLTINKGTKWYLIDVYVDRGFIVSIHNIQISETYSLWYDINKKIV